MAQIVGFPPIADRRAEILILGSIPGLRSLERQQYYAHPHNAFWWIMGELFGAWPTLPYPERAERLVQQRIALWDVLQGCYRPGSLDTAIAPGSEVPNDFAGLFAGHPRLRAVFFNGSKAEQAFRRHVLPGLGRRIEGLRLVRLPSTSPALATLSREQKLAAWGVLRAELGPAEPNTPAALGGAKGQVPLP